MHNPVKSIYHTHTTDNKKHSFSLLLTIDNLRVIGSNTLDLKPDWPWKVIQNHWKMNQLSVYNSPMMAINYTNWFPLHLCLLTNYWYDKLELPFLGVPPTAFRTLTLAFDHWPLPFNPTIVMDCYGHDPYTCKRWRSEVTQRVEKDRWTEGWRWLHYQTH